ncbi:ROK family protein [Sulfitobacter sp. S0837]|uniref:glucokinase n=1 Tax=Sulfitobacter maritimus TaxID=2741719 RepID=UPI001582372D|nr:ROK family protein [Sulfitobacter maritimus]NUH67179.1 ROK family protein [Sulfitobacter maritimus]
MWYLVGDVGGTNLRLAAVDEGGEFKARQSRSTAGKAALAETCAALISEMGRPPKSVAIAAAGVVAEDRVTFTNAALNITKAGLAEACDLPATDIVLLNDFEAAAWSLATLEPAQVTYLQGGPEPEPGPRVIIGPGTGLGVGALLWRKGQPLAVPGEGGHMRLTPHSMQEAAYFEALIAAWPEVQMGQGLAVEAEAILSGTGMPKWYRAIAKVRRREAPLQTAAAIFDAAQAKKDQSAIEAVAHFARYLGGLAGDLGLIFGARGGVFITGGVAQSNPWLFTPDFCDAFNAGGRHSNWRRDMPLGLCQDPDFGLKGARNCLFARVD